MTVNGRRGLKIRMTEEVSDLAERNAALREERRG
jgi:hypothetical protein